MTTFLGGRVDLRPGDCREVVAAMEPDSIDSCVSDPPYALVSIVKRFGKSGAAASRGNEAYARASAGFMGKQWDTGEAAFDPKFWAQVLRVLKPGAHLLAFSGTRSYHRLACAIEDAGFEIRDQIGWAYGSGFPKSHNQHGEWEGWGTALKPAWEPIVMARKPFDGTVAANVLRHGTGAINIDACRIAADDKTLAPVGTFGGSEIGPVGHTGARDDGRSDHLGRWPANLIHDGSDEVLAAFPDSAGGGNVHQRSSPKAAGIYGDFAGDTARYAGYADGNGSAARFFYTAKADTEDRIGSKHPTVKPLDLMQYLVRLVTPERGVVLDPFAGTGTTGEAAWREGFSAILVEREPEYMVDIARRMELADNPSKRAAVAKSKNNLRGAEGTPLFGDEAAA